MAEHVIQPESFPDMPEFGKSLSEQVEEILDEVRLTTTTSVGRLFEWIVKNPGPTPVATAAMVVLLKTKEQFTPADKRLSLLYAVHEVFKRASKDTDMKFDYRAWEDALKALVPWTWRKQKEEDQMKIKKSVLKTWVTSHWLRKDFVENLIPIPGGTPKKQPGAAGGGGVKRGRPSSSGRSSSGGSTGGAHRDNDDSITNAKPNNSGDHDVRDNTKPVRTVDEDEEQAAAFGVGVDYGNTENRSPVRARLNPDLISAVVPLPSPPPGAIAAAEAAGLPEMRGTSSGGGGVNTVTPSPEGNRADGGSPDGIGVGVVVEKESAHDAQRRILSLTLDGCGLIRRVGTSMNFPVRVMLTAFHLFHHYEWCGSVEAFRFPPSSLPAVCLACLLAATKAEDCNTKLETLLREMRQLEPLLPPMDGVFPLGKRPDTKEVINLEYKLLLSRGFDLEMVHPMEHVAALLALTRAPIEVGELAYEVLCSRVYTDSTLCLEEDPMTCLCAAVQFALLSPMPRGQTLEKVRKGMLEDWPMLCGATKALLMSFTERLVQSARDLAEFAPAQTFMIDRGSSGPHHDHNKTSLHSSTRVGSGGGGGGGGGGGVGAAVGIASGGGGVGVSRSPYSSKTPDRTRGRATNAAVVGGSERPKPSGSLGGGGSGNMRRTPPSRINASRPKVMTRCTPGAAGRGGGISKRSGTGAAAVVAPTTAQIRPLPAVSAASSSSPPPLMLPLPTPVVEDTHSQQALQQPRMSLVLETTARRTGGPLVNGATEMGIGDVKLPVTAPTHTLAQQHEMPAAKTVGIAGTRRDHPSLAVQKLQQQLQRQLHHELVRQRQQQAVSDAGQRQPSSYRYDKQKDPSDSCGLGSGGDGLNGGQDKDQGDAPPAVAGFFGEPLSIPPDGGGGAGAGSGNAHRRQHQQQQQLLDPSPQHPHNSFHHSHDHPPGGDAEGQGAQPPPQTESGLHSHGHDIDAAHAPVCNTEQQHSGFVSANEAQLHQHQPLLSVSPPGARLLQLPEQQEEHHQHIQHPHRQHHHEQQMNDEMLGRNPNARLHSSHDTNDAYRSPEENNCGIQHAGDNIDENSYTSEHNQGRHGAQYDQNHHEQSLGLNYGDVIDGRGSSSNGRTATGSGGASSHDTGPASFPVDSSSGEHHGRHHELDPSFHHDRYASPYQQHHQEGPHSHGAQVTGDVGGDDGVRGASSFTGEYLPTGKAMREPLSLGGESVVDNEEAIGWDRQQLLLQQQQQQHYEDNINAWIDPEISVGGVGSVHGIGIDAVVVNDGADGGLALPVAEDDMVYPAGVPPLQHPHQQQQQRQYHQHSGADWDGGGLVDGW